MFICCSRYCRKDIDKTEVIQHSIFQSLDTLVWICLLYSLVRGLRAAITAIFPTDLVSSYITNCWPCFWHVILCHTCMHARTNSWIVYSRRRWILPMLRPAGVALQDPSSVVTENVDVKRISKPRLIALPSHKSKNTRLTSRSDLSAHTRQIGLKSRSSSPRSAIAYR